MELTRLMLLFPVLAIPIAVYQLDKFAVEGGGEALFGPTLQLVAYGACAVALPLLIWWASPRTPELTSDGTCLAWRRGRHWQRWPLHELRHGLGRWQMSRMGVVGSILHLECRGQRLSVGAHNALFDDPGAYQLGSADVCDLLLDEQALRDLLAYLATTRDVARSDVARSDVVALGPANAPRSAASGFAAQPAYPGGERSPARVTLQLRPWPNVALPALAFGGAMLGALFVGAALYLVQGPLPGGDVTLGIVVWTVIFGVVAGVFLYRRARRARPLRIVLDGNDLRLEAGADGQTLAVAPLSEVRAEPCRFQTGGHTPGTSKYYFGAALLLHVPGTDELTVGALVSPPWGHRGRQIATPRYQLGSAELDRLCTALRVGA